MAFEWFARTMVVGIGRINRASGNWRAELSRPLLNGQSKPHQIVPGQTLPNPKPLIDAATRVKSGH